MANSIEKVRKVNTSTTLFNYANVLKYTTIDQSSTVQSFKCIYFINTVYSCISKNIFLLVYLLKDCEVISFLFRWPMEWITCLQIKLYGYNSEISPLLYSRRVGVFHRWTHSTCDRILRLARRHSDEPCYSRAVLQ